MDRRTIGTRKWGEIVCLMLVAAMLSAGGCAFSRVPQNKVAARTSPAHAHQPRAEAQDSAWQPSGVAAPAANPTDAALGLAALDDPFLDRSSAPAPAGSRPPALFGAQDASPQPPPPAMRLAQAEPKYARALTRPTVLHASADSFDQQVLQSDVPVLVDFYATWCGPCKALAPTLEELAGESPQARIVKVDIDASPDLAARYGVRSVPSLMVFKDGQVTAKQMGVTSKARLKAMLDM